MLKFASNKMSTFIGTTAAVLVLTSGITSHAFAQESTQDQISTRPVTIGALCQEADGTPLWRIGNPNDSAVSLTWDEASDPGITLPYGYTTVGTTLGAHDDPTAVTFHQPGQPDVTVLVSGDACASPIEGCVEGYTRGNLTYTWSRNGSVTVATKDGKPLCDDVTVYFAAYTLPKTYDESGIFDDSSVPQQLFSSTSAVLGQGTDGNTTLTTKVPDACTDYQLDLYYAPEITSVSYPGHGAQLIYGDIYLHTTTDCTTDGHVLAATTTAGPTLADTGQSTALPMLGAVALMAAALVVKFPVLQRTKRLLGR